MMFCVFLFHGEMASTAESVCQTNYFRAGYVSGCFLTTHTRVC